MKITYLKYSDNNLMINSWVITEGRGAGGAVASMEAVSGSCP